MSSSPDIPASPTTTPPPTSCGLNVNDDCDIPLVEIMNIDSTLPTNTSRSETPISDDSDNDAIIESPGSPDPDPETKARVDAIVRYQKLTMFRFGILLQSAPYVNIPLLAEAEIALLGKLCPNITLSCGYCAVDGLYQIRSPMDKPLLATMHPEASLNLSHSSLLKLETIERPYCVQEFKVLHTVNSSLQQRICAWRLQPICEGYIVKPPMCIKSPDGMYHPLMANVKLFRMQVPSKYTVHSK